jgi:hypothetical protein
MGTGEMTPEVFVEPIVTGIKYILPEIATALPTTIRIKQISRQGVRIAQLLIPVDARRQYGRPKIHTVPTSWEASGVIQPA